MGVVVRPAADARTEEAAVNGGGEGSNRVSSDSRAIVALYFARCRMNYRVAYSHRNAGDDQFRQARVPAAVANLSAMARVRRRETVRP